MHACAKVHCIWRKVQVGTRGCSRGCYAGPAMLKSCGSRAGDRFLAQHALVAGGPRGHEVGGRVGNCGLAAQPGREGERIGGRYGGGWWLLGIATTIGGRLTTAALRRPALGGLVHVRHSCVVLGRYARRRSLMVAALRIMRLVASPGEEIEPVRRMLLGRGNACIRPSCHIRVLRIPRRSHLGWFEVRGRRWRLQRGCDGQSGTLNIELVSGESLFEHTFIDGWEDFLGAGRDGKEQTVSMSKGYNFADGNAREARSCMLCKSWPKITSHATMGRRQRGRAHTLSKLTPSNLGAVITGGLVMASVFQTESRPSVRTAQHAMGRCELQGLHTLQNTQYITFFM